MKRILACLFIMAALPLLASSVYNSPAPFAQVAIAGHVIGGTVWCECGSSNCICDPGEIPGTNLRTPASDRDGKAAIQDASPGLDFGSGALLMALAFLVWVRLLRP
ncbi:MAG: hypothetical protein WBV94_13960 [Blastocatellia bacterium]